MQKENWENEILVHELFFENIEIPKIMKLNNSTEIIDVDKFIKSHLAIVKANNGNLIFRPYLDRLIVLKNLLEKQKANSLDEIRKIIKNKFKDNGSIDN